MDAVQSSSAAFFENPRHAASAPNQRAAEERTIRAPHRYSDPTTAVPGSSARQA